MSSLTDGARRSMSPAGARAVRRARLAPYFSGVFALAVIAILVLFAVQAGLLEQLTPTPPKPAVAVPSEKITVGPSTVTGFDEQRQPYSMTARSGVQDKDIPNHVHLDMVKGEINRTNGDVVDVRADRGIYDTDSKQLGLSGKVVIVSKGRFTARMDSAHVDVNKKSLDSQSPVDVDLSGGGKIDAKGLKVTNNGDNVLFSGGVHAKFKNSSMNSGGAQ